MSMLRPHARFLCRPLVVGALALSAAFARGADAPSVPEPPAALFQYVQGSMPNDEPSSLADEQYWDVLAFLITQQGVQTGAAPLGPETAMNVPTKAP